MNIFFWESLYCWYSTYLVILTCSCMCLHVIFNFLFFWFRVEKNCVCVSMKWLIIIWERERLTEKKIALSTSLLDFHMKCQYAMCTMTQKGLLAALLLTHCALTREYRFSTKNASCLRLTRQRNKRFFVSLEPEKTNM